MKSLMKVLPRSTVLGSGSPSALTIIAGLVLAGLTVADFLLLSSARAKPYRDAIAAVLTAAGAYGIQPLFGPALTNLMHIPAQALFLISVLITTANGVLAAVTMSLTAHTIIGAVLTGVAAILFGSPAFGPLQPVTPAAGVMGQEVHD